MRDTALIVLALLLVPAWPAAAQMGGGFAGSSVGLPAGGVPANPFASNYPSAAPQAASPARLRDRRPVRRGRAMRPPAYVGR